MVSLGERFTQVELVGRASVATALSTAQAKERNNLILWYALERKKRGEKEEEKKDVGSMLNESNQN